MQDVFEPLKKLISKYIIGENTDLSKLRPETARRFLKYLEKHREMREYLEPTKNEKLS